MAAYYLTTENNTGQYYPDYAYNHLLFIPCYKIYSDSTISEFIGQISVDDSVEFQNEWNALKKNKDKIYISYDSANKNCQVGDIELVEYGHAKEDKGLPVFNYSIAYDCNNREALFYEDSPGSIVDVSQLQYMLDKALVNDAVKEVRGTFEDSRQYTIRRFGVSGTTVERTVFPSDERNRSMRVYTGDALAGKMLVAFVALIIRNRMHTKLKDEEEKLPSSPNFMNVPAAIRELEKIEMIRQATGLYA